MTSDNGKGDKSCTSQPAEHSTPISSSFYRTLSLARRAAASLESCSSFPGSVSFHRPSDTKLSPTSIRGGGGGTVRPQHIIFRTQQAKPPSSSFSSWRTENFFHCLPFFALSQFSYRTPSAVLIPPPTNDMV